MTAARPDPTGPWVVSVRELGRRAGTMRTEHRSVVASDHVGLEGVLSVPPGSPIELDIRLESVSEGVFVSGTASAALCGQCARCLDPLTDEITVQFGELFAYPDSVTDQTTESDELSRVVDELVDIEEMVRDAIVLALPLAPLCREDCPGLCPDCGAKRADLGPDHRHDTMDPRWAALRERLDQ
jgi:uncharacterized protein